jgi:predicted pyridoxine 5'-phosphate oxidase superfamily flavin-nucleotide-binding protein
MREMIESADTFFIATAYRGNIESGERPHGADVSHRGGNPGFVRLGDEHTLTVPDFIGNSYFNTIGNLLLEPRAGLLFIDFAAGDLLYLAADADVVFAGEELRAFAGAERLLRFRVREALRVERSLPLRWSEAELSPFLASMR